MLDLLLGAENITERPEDEVEVTRLSKKLGQPFILKIKALTMREFDAVPVGADRPAHIVLAGVTEPSFASEQLRKKYTPAGRQTPITPVELINTLLLPGEVINTYNAITELSGFGEGAVAKIEKN